jgi:flagellar biosynthesis protein FlhA
MPGKQMAIDADLNTGQITDEEARRRRAEIAQEADFYGAMDGASKFVKGDAMAGILITGINLIGGIVIGVVPAGHADRRGRPATSRCCRSATACARRSPRC